MSASDGSLAVILDVTGGTVRGPRALLLPSLRDRRNINLVIVTADRSVQICRALATAAALEERARANPDQADRLTDLARKLRVGAAMLTAEVRAANGRCDVPPKSSI